MVNNAEVHDQRQVIRSRADQLASRHLDAEHVDRSAAKNMVNAQHWHARGKGSTRALVQHELGITQLGREHAIDDGPAPGIEIAQQDNRIAALRVAEPVFAQQSPGLRHALVGRQAEVRVYDLNLGAVCLDGRPECPARFETDASRQRSSLHQAHR